MHSQCRRLPARARWCASLAFGLGFVLVAAQLAAQLGPAFGQEPERPAHEGVKAKPLSLADAIDRALAVSPGLKAATAGIDAARGSERQAGLLPNPELSFEAENVKGSGPYRGFDSAEYTYGVSQEIPLGGQRAARRGVARAEREVAELGANAAQLDLVQAVTGAYFEAVAAKQSLALAKDLETTAKRVRDTVRERVHAAREPEIQLTKAEVALAAASAALDRVEHTSEAARQALARFWGDAVFAETLSTTELYTLPAPQALEIYQDRLAQSPDITKLARLRDARIADHRLARAEIVPSPKVSVGVRQFRDTGDDALVAGISIPFPVLNWNQGEIARSRAEVVKADSERQQFELDQGRALSTSWSQWQSALAEAKSLKERIRPQAEKAFRLSVDGYHAGRFSYLEVLDAQRTLFETRAEEIDAFKRLHVSRAEVERLAPDLSRTPSVK